jgi:hypothetical protein
MLADIPTSFSEPTMQIVRPLVAILGLLFAVQHLCAADLTKVDRTIRKEPVYLSKSPKYCLLVFGPKAETRVWLVLDLVSEPYDAKGNRDVLYVDKNGSGDLTEPGKRIPVSMKTWKEDLLLKSTFRLHAATLKAWEDDPEKRLVTRCAPRFEIGTITEQGGARHTDLVVEVESYIQYYRPCTVSLKANGEREQRAGGRLLRFADRPEDAPIIHFNGPLALVLHMQTGLMYVPISYESDGPERRRWYEQHPPAYEERKLVRGQEGDLCVQLGTPGLGRGTFATLSAGVPPPQVDPHAEITFPHRDPARPPIVVSLPLKQRC